MDEVRLSRLRVVVLHDQRPCNLLDIDDAKALLAAGDADGVVSHSDGLVLLVGQAEDLVGEIDLLGDNRDGNGLGKLHDALSSADQLSRLGSGGNRVFLGTD